MMLKRKIVEFLIKVYQLDYLIFIYSPAELVLACTDLATESVMNQPTQGEQITIDLPSLFPTFPLEKWDKVAMIKEVLRKY